jgi:class 3 adenylate cyclase
MGSAQGSATMVSSTVKDLMVGSGVTFADKGKYVLKGIEGEWRLYEVVDSSEGRV